MTLLGNKAGYWSMQEESRYRVLSSLVLLLIISTFSIRAQDSSETTPRPGHSLHGEAFDEGPRQRAYLMQGMPDLNFPVNTRSPDAQKFFNQGRSEEHTSELQSRLHLVCRL